MRVFEGIFAHFQCGPATLINLSTQYLINSWRENEQMKKIRIYLDHPDDIQTIRNLSKLSRNCPDHWDDIQTIRNFSRLSGNFPSYPETQITLPSPPVRHEERFKTAGQKWHMIQRRSTTETYTCGLKHHSTWVIRRINLVFGSYHSFIYA